MSDITDDITYEYDVFIIFAGCDNKKASEIFDSLESQNFKCLDQRTYEAFKAGTLLFDSIVKNMKKSKTILLVLTKDSFNSTWVCLETILALEQSVQRGQLALRFVLCDNVQEAEVRFLNIGLLDGIPDITMSSKDWKELLAESLKKRIDLPDILPVGCLAHGQVFSHFVGYLVHLLPRLEEIIEETEVYKERPYLVSKKLFMVLPGSCELPSTLDREDQDSGVTIETVPTLEREYPHAGKERVLNPPLYKVRKGDEEYFFIADLPNVLNSIFKIASNKLAKVDIRLQIARFYYTMNEVLNHASTSKTCDKKVILLPFHDSTENMADVVFKAVRKDVLAQNMQAVMDQPSSTAPDVQRFLPRPDYKYDILIVAGDDAQDRNIAHAISNFMEENDKTVGLQKTYYNLDDARWVVFIISKASIKHDKFMLSQCESVLKDSVDQNMLRTLPVLVDVEPDMMPQIIKWVTVVSVREPEVSVREPEVSVREPEVSVREPEVSVPEPEDSVREPEVSVREPEVSVPNYLRRLLQTVNGDTITVEDRLPSGDVSTGLTWAYVLNYLLLALLSKTESNLDFKERIEKLLRDKNEQFGCIHKLFLLVPKSCLAKSDIEAEANTGAVQRIQKVGRLEPIEVDKRKYFLHMYKYTDHNSGQSTCFVCEYVTPINCLHEMAHTYPFAGLHEDEMQRQAGNFVQLFPTIISRKAVKEEIGDITDMVQLIYFEDEKVSLLSALESQIKFQKVDRAKLVSAQH